MAGKTLAQASEGPPLPFRHVIVTDPSGRILVAYAVRPLAMGTPASPPQCLALASGISSEGLLPPRGAVARPVIDGHLLSVAGDRVVLHLLYESPPPPDDAAHALRAVLDFEEAYKTHLGAARADSGVFSAAAPRLSRSFREPLPFRAERPVSSRLFVHATVEPRGPGVLLVLRLRNFTRESARGVSVTFQSPKDFLRPAALYGTGAAVGASAVHLLEALEPGEKLIELRLEPQEPHTGPLTLALRAANGWSVPARAIEVKVEVPKIVAPDDDPAFMAGHVMLREGEARDIWRLRFTRAVDPAFAFERAKEVVERERPLKLLEFSAPWPAYHEAWYLGRIKPSGAPVLVEVAVRGPGRIVEFRVATDAQADLLGIKAEYRRRLRELLSEKFMGRKAIVQRSQALPPSLEETAPHMHSALLMRHLQGEIGAEELWHELRRTATGGSGEGWQHVAAFGEALGPLKGGEPAAVARGVSLAGMHAEKEAIAGLFETYTRLMAPVVLAQTARMVRTGARLRTGMDSSAEAEAEAADGED